MHLSSPVSKADVRLKVVVLLLLINCVLMLREYVYVPCTLCLFLICNHLCGEERAGCFPLMLFLMYCDCYCFVAFPHGAKVWSAVCDCGIS